jgi:hypothetical protein
MRQSFFLKKVKNFLFLRFLSKKRPFFFCFLVVLDVFKNEGALKSEVFIEKGVSLSLLYLLYI